MYIVDLQETETIDICVKWAFPRMWALVPPASVAQTTIDEAIETGTDYTDYANGFIYVVPITKLQSPDDSSIFVNVYVRSENMEVFAFNEAYLPNDFTIPAISSDLIEESSQMHPISCINVNESNLDRKDKYIHHFGESISSFRSLLKRYSTTATKNDLSVTTDSGTVISTFAIVPNVYTSPSGGSFGSVGNPNLFDYVRFCYAGRRGGIRKRFRVVTRDGGNNMQRVHVRFKTPGTTYNGENVNWNESFTSGCGLTGTLMYSQHTNSGIEYEIPFYSDNLFLPSSVYDIARTDDSCYSLFNYYLYFIETELSPTVTYAYVLEESATGEDHMFFRFVAVPPYRVPSS